MPFQPEGLCGRGRWGLCLAEEETQSSVTVCPCYTTVTQQTHQGRPSPAEPNLVPPGPSKRLQMLCRGACCPPEPTESRSHHAATTDSSMGAPCSTSAGECQSFRWISRTDYTTSCVICTAVMMCFAETSGFPVK